MTIVVATGGFDPLHSGHIAYLNEAKQLGDILIVGLNSDDWLCRKKGKPFLPFNERRIILSNLAMVDNVIEFNDSDDSATHAIFQSKVLFPNNKIIFANGGDRTNNNTPEQDQYGTDPQISFVFGVGGATKANSSSWILEAWKSPKTIRPWGYYRVLLEKSDYKVKELVIEPGKSLSEQRHFLRDEQWTVLEGTCVVHTVWDGKAESITLNITSPKYTITKDVWHRAENISNTPCHILEIQRGERCVEEDIERKQE